MELTAGVRSLTWRLGMAKPFERVARVATARVVVSNHAQQYSGDAPSVQLGHHLRIQYARESCTWGTGGHSTAGGGTGRAHRVFDGGLSVRLRWRVWWWSYLR
ncbi:MAG UNVERIFIED_CONTAM: hypothetical protein LVT10_15985 [Anaerolineae bacterium]